MSTRLTVGPFNRVEGDLEVHLDVEEGRIAAAYVNSPLFRGFEQMLVGRAPLDALVMVPRICGICSVAQSAAAAAALADAMGLVPTPNGRIMRHLVQATENLADHLTHFYLFFMPDFARTAYAGHSWHEAVAARFVAVKGSATAQVLPARAVFLSLMGLLAGKWPHSLALQPGGTTHALNDAERLRVRAVLRQFRDFLEKTLFGDRLEAVAALDSAAALATWAKGRSGDFPAFLDIAASLGLEQIGRASDRFMSYGAYDLLPQGLSQGAGACQVLEPAKILEHTRHAWLADGEARHPSTGETLVAPDKAGAYTWCKAPRYDGQTVEVGALARQVVAGHPLLLDLVRAHGGSVTARVAARMIELAEIVPRMETWIQSLVSGEPYCLHGNMPDSGQGVGLVEAARGSLGHWLSIRQGRIERYQIVAPTTWNFSPRDAAGQPGPLETALVGIAAGGDSLPTLQHVVRSFDPCMVCTVH